MGNSTEFNNDSSRAVSVMPRSGIVTLGVDYSLQTIDQLTGVSRFASVLENFPWNFRCSRRRLFKGGLFGGLALTSAACSPSREQIILAKEREARDVLRVTASQELGMAQRAMITMPAGIKTYIFTNSTQLNVNQDHVVKAFDAVFEVLDSQKESVYKALFQQAKEAAKNGKLRDREVDIFASANPNTCIVDGRIIAIPEIISPIGFCSAGARLISVASRDQQTQKMSAAHFSTVYLTAAANAEGKSIVPIENTRLTLPPAQAMGINLSYMGVYTYLRMIGIMPSEGEEIFVKGIVKDLLGMYSANESKRPFPFSFPHVSTAS